MVAMVPLMGGHGGPPPLTGGPPGQRPNPPLVWFTPGPGTLDMLRLFEEPGEWNTARERISVFKFYRSQLLDTGDPMVGPNTYDALRAADAFRKLAKTWRKRIAIEVAVVKDYSCTEDMSGTDAEIRNALKAVAAVRAAGGEVQYFALDEPFTATVQSPRCGGRDLRATLARLDRFFAHVRLAAPRVEIGLIEQFPISSGTEILDYVRQMKARGIRPAFFHLDADLNALPKGSDRFEKEIPPLAAALEDEGIPFGIIFFGHSGESDSDYYDDALDFVERAGETLSDLPRDIVFQSWAESKTGRRITPANLPEWERGTHTALINAGLDTLRQRR